MTTLTERDSARRASSTANTTPRRTSLRPRVAPWVFLAPALILFVMFMLIPIAYSIYLSVMGLRSTGGAFGIRQQTFVGLDNYIATLTDPELLASLGRLAIFAMISVPLTLGLALLFALLLDLPRVRLQRFSRLAIFLPYAVPGVIGALLWGFLYLPSTSPLTYALNAVGLPAADLLNGSWLYLSLSNIAIWAGVGFNMIVMYTALRSIPTELYEAAKIDGASEWQIAWRIKVPLLTPALILTFLFSIIATLQAYSEPTTLRTMSNSISFNFFPLMKIYRDAFGLDNTSGAAAASVLLALGTLAISLGLLRLLQRRTFGES